MYAYVYPAINETRTDSITWKEKKLKSNDENPWRKWAEFLFVFCSIRLWLWCKYNIMWLIQRPDELISNANNSFHCQIFSLERRKMKIAIENPEKGFNFRFIRTTSKSISLFDSLIKSWDDSTVSTLLLDTFIRLKRKLHNLKLVRYSTDACLDENKNECELFYARIDVNNDNNQIPQYNQTFDLNELQYFKRERAVFCLFSRWHSSFKLKRHFWYQLRWFSGFSLTFCYLSSEQFFVRKLSYFLSVSDLVASMTSSAVNNLKWNVQWTEHIRPSAAIDRNFTCYSYQSTSICK